MDKNIEIFRENTNKKNLKIAKEVFNKVDYKEEEIEFAILNHYSEKKLEYAEKHGISIDAVYTKAKSIIDDVMLEVKEQGIENDIAPHLLCAIAGFINKLSCEAVLYANEKAKSRQKEKKEHYNEVSKLSIELYKDGKIGNKDLCALVEYGSLKLGDIASNLGFDVANEVLKLASKNLDDKIDDKKETINKPEEDVIQKEIEEDMNTFYNLLSNEEGLSFEEFKEEISKITDEIIVTIFGDTKQ